MNPETKVLYRQLQLAGLGLVIAIVGALASNRTCIFIGLGFFLYGLLRTWLLARLIHKSED